MYTFIVLLHGIVTVTCDLVVLGSLYGVIAVKRHLCCVFAYICSILIDKDLCEIRNVEIEFLCISEFQPEIPSFI